MLLSVVKDVPEKKGVGCVWLYFYWDVLCAFESTGICSERTGFRESVSKVC